MSTQNNPNLIASSKTDEKQLGRRLASYVQTKLSSIFKDRVDYRDMNMVQKALKVRMRLALLAGLLPIIFIMALEAYKIKVPHTYYIAAGNDGIVSKYTHQLITKLDQRFDGNLIGKDNKDELLSGDFNALYRPHIEFKAVKTSGLLENQKRIETDSNVALADCQETQDSQDDAAGQLRALANLFDASLQVVVIRNEVEDHSMVIQANQTSKIKNIHKMNSFADIAGKRIVTGPKDSGTYFLLSKLFAHYGIKIDALQPPVTCCNKFQDATSAMYAGKYDVLVLSTPVGSPAISQFACDPKNRFTLLGIDRADGFAKANPTYASMTIPPGSYSGPVIFPDHPISTIASHDILVCRADLPNVDAYNIVKTIFETKHEFLSQFPAVAGIQRLDDKAKSFIPIHPGAWSYYNQNNTPLPIPWQLLGLVAGSSVGIYRYLRFWIRKPIFKNLSSCTKQEEEYVDNLNVPVEDDEFQHSRGKLFDLERNAVTYREQECIRDDQFVAIKDRLRVCLNKLQNKRQLTALQCGYKETECGLKDLGLRHALAQGKLTTGSAGNGSTEENTPSNIDRNKT